ncbi:MAG TPA: nucleotidyltransferase family protein [Terriglobia bacterium]|nr:nucleotidyltransferase family protein [Terriglobia bacterium]
MIAGIVLAAGESSRMGTDKARLGYKNSTFLETILNTLGAAGVERVAVVLGHHAEEIRRTMNLGGAEVSINGDYRRGQTSSLQTGLKALEGTELEAVIVCLVDHPAVSAHTLRRLVDSFSASRPPVVIPTYQGRRGHPVVIGRPLFDELKSLGPDAGANTVVHKYQAAAQFVEVNDPGVLLDIDDPESYRRLIEG